MPVFPLPGSRIDAHTSLWRQSTPETRGHPCFPGDERPYLPEHLAPILQRSRVDAAVLVTAGTSEAERQTLAEWIAGSPVLWGLVAGWSEALPECATARSLLATRQLLGVWVPAPATPGQGSAAADAASSLRALAFCEEHHLPLDLLPPAGTCAFAEIPHLAAMAKTPVVLAHLGAAPADNISLQLWMDSMRALAAMPHVFVKLSALHSSTVRTWPVSQLAALFQFLVDIFGVERLMFGSDWPYCLPTHSWKECLARFTQALGARSQEFREHLLGGTALRVYRGLPEGGLQAEPAPTSKR